MLLSRCRVQICSSARSSPRSRCALEFWPRLNAARQNALIEMAYQMGVEHEEAFRDMVAAIRVAVASGRVEDWALVEEKGFDSAWAKQTPDRARRVMDQLRTGVFPT